MMIEQGLDTAISSSLKFVTDAMNGALVAIHATNHDWFRQWDTPGSFLRFHATRIFLRMRHTNRSDAMCDLERSEQQCWEVSGKERDEGNEVASHTVEFVTHPINRSLFVTSFRALACFCLEDELVKIE